METNLSKNNLLRRNFYRQLFTYVIVMLFLAFLNYLYFNGYWWVIWPAAGWGIAILIHAVHVCFPYRDEANN